MKELKLKAWDKITNQIATVWAVEWKALDGINGGINLVKIELDGVVERSEHEIELIEFTGQQDINKADVFVGDYFGFQYTGTANAYIPRQVRYRYPDNYLQ